MLSIPPAWSALAAAAVALLLDAGMRAMGRDMFSSRCWLKSLTSTRLANTCSASTKARCSSGSTCMRKRFLSSR